MSERNKVKTRSVVNSTLSTVLLVMMIVTVAISVTVILLIAKINLEISSLQAALAAVQPPDTLGENNAAFLQYQQISEHADTQMGTLVAIAGIFMTIYTLLGGVLMFKAPRDIDKNISEIEEIAKTAKDEAENVKYLQSIYEATSNEYNGKQTGYQKVQSLSPIIRQNPDKPDAYYTRAIFKDAIKDYNGAIKDYFRAIELMDESDTSRASCYSCLSVAYSKVGNNNEALKYINKAIELEPNDSVYYSNRAAYYSELNEHEHAFADYDRALILDDGNVVVLKNRFKDYWNLMRNENDIDKKMQYLKLSEADIDRAFALDKEDKVTKEYHDQLHQLLDKTKQASIQDVEKLVERIKKRIAELEEEERKIENSQQEIG